MNRTLSSDTLSRRSVRSAHGRLQRNAMHRSVRSLHSIEDTLSRMTLDDTRSTISNMCLSIPPQGCVRPVQSFIGPLWRGLLAKWLQDGRSITITTAQIDPDHVAEIGRLMVFHRKHRPEVRLYVPRKCYGSKKWHDVKSRAKRLLRIMKNKRLRRLITDEDMAWIFKTLIVREVNNVSCNFISSHDAFRGEILVTTSTFHRDNFLHGNMAFVHFARVDSSALRGDFFASLDTFLVH